MIKLVQTKIADSKFWWKIRNEKTVREVSFDTKSIPYSTHKKWFEEKLKNKNSKLFLIMNKGKKIGQLRLEKNNSEVEVSIALAPTARGKGLGNQAIRLGVKFALEKMSTKKILAFTKPENLGSIKAFEKAGFKNLSEVNYKDSRAILLEFSD